jgi:hypothetical protein
MAKTTAPLLSFGASGQIGKTLVSATWKGRAYMRRYTIPSNPQTSGQTTTRTVFQTANGIWKIAPTLFTAPWDAFASGQVLTGRNAMVGQFISAVRGETDLNLMPFSPGALAGPAPVSVSAASGANQAVVTITAPTPPTGWSVSALVAAAILNQDPEAPTDLSMVADSEASGDVTLTGLTSSVEYEIGGWIEWLRPDGRTAYGPSLNDQVTPS